MPSRLHMSSGYKPLLSHSYPACNVMQHNVIEGVVLVKFKTLHQINIKKKFMVAIQNLLHNTITVVFNMCIA